MAPIYIFELSDYPLAVYGRRVYTLDGCPELNCLPLTGMMPTVPTLPDTASYRPRPSRSSWALHCHLRWTGAAVRIGTPSWAKQRRGDCCWSSGLGGGVGFAW